MKRLPLIIGIAVGVLVLALIAYFLFFRGDNGGVSAIPGSQFPDGEGVGIAAPDVGVPQDAGDEVAPSLIRITEGPVAFGAIASSTVRFQTQGEDTTTETVRIPETEVRYVERETGNIYAFRLNERTLTRLTNRTLPGIQEASWFPDASMAFVRFMDETNASETYALPADGGEGYALERNLADVAVTESSVVTLMSSTNGSVATVANANGTNARTLFTSLLSSLRLHATDSTVFAATKAASVSDGYLFKTGTSFERILGPLKGLTALPSPSGTQVIYSYVSGNTTRSGLYNLSTHTATALPVVALPDKCVWTDDEKRIYCGIPRTVGIGWPDTWYQGVAHFTDRIWRIDVDARIASLVVDPKLVADADIDAVALEVDPVADALVFTNKTDGSLWLYDL